MPISSLSLEGMQVITHKVLSKTPDLIPNGAKAELVCQLLCFSYTGRSECRSNESMLREGEQLNSILGIFSHQECPCSKLDRNMNGLEWEKLTWNGLRSSSW